MKGPALDRVLLVALFLLGLFLSYRFGVWWASSDGIPPPLSPQSRLQDDSGAQKPTNSSVPWIETISWTPRIQIYHHILTEEDCDHVIKIAGKDVQRSMVVAGTGNQRVDEVRTSYGVFITQYMNDPVVKKLSKKIAEWTHLPESHGEIYNLLRYENGQQYMPHWDYFSVNDYGSDFGGCGNRIATVLTYLGTPEEGGETIFPKATPKQLLVPAVKGSAVLFWDAKPDGKPDPLSMHGGKPVLKGTKWAMTRWLRAKPCR